MKVAAPIFQQVSSSDTGTVLPYTYLKADQYNGMCVASLPPNKTEWDFEAVMNVAGQGALYIFVQQESDNHATSGSSGNTTSKSRRVFR